MASTGSGANGRALIWSTEDNKWVVIFSMSANYTEGNKHETIKAGYLIYLFILFVLYDLLGFEFAVRIDLTKR